MATPDPNKCITFDILNLSSLNITKKPANILISENFEIKICDFGFATEIAAGVSGTKSLVGTIKFVAPEMWKQERNYSHEIDWFALGILAGEMLSEALIFDPYKNEDPEKESAMPETQQWRNCLINDEPNLDVFQNEEMRDLIKGVIATISLKDHLIINIGMYIKINKQILLTIKFYFSIKNFQVLVKNVLFFCI